MKKMLCLLFMTLFVFAVSACGGNGENVVENEKDALAVYDCSSSNMFGLEKIVFFENKVVTVFDKSINDKSDCGTCMNGVNSNNNYGTYVTVDGVSRYKITEAGIEEKDGKYISTVNYEYGDDDKKSGDVSGVVVCEQIISVKDDGINLSFVLWGGECSNDYYQSYDFSTKSWSEIQEEFKLYPLTCE